MSLISNYTPLLPYPTPSTFNPNKPTIFVSLLRTRFPRVLCAFLTAPVTQSVISLLQHAICHMQRQNLQLIQVFFIIFVCFHLCILLSCLLRHVSQARLTIKRLTITATVMRCCIYVWFCLHSIPKKSKTFIHDCKLTPNTSVIPVYISCIICYCCCFFCLLFCLFIPSGTHSVFCSCSMSVITFVSCLACFHYFLANFNSSVVSPIASDSLLCIQLTPGNELLLIRPRGGGQQRQEAK